MGTGRVSLPRQMDATDRYETGFKERLQRALGEGFRLGDRLGRGGFVLVYSRLRNTPTP